MTATRAIAVTLIITVTLLALTFATNIKLDPEPDKAREVCYKVTMKVAPVCD